MAAPDSTHLWSWLADQVLSRGKPLRLRARFSGDVEGKTPVFLVVREGEPMVEPSPEARALFDQVDPQMVVSRFIDQAQSTR